MCHQNGPRPSTRAVCGVRASEVIVVIQIERFPAQSIRRCARRCSVPQCMATANWFLVDRAMPIAHEASMGERACCTEHIAPTYASLRGAHVVAQATRGDQHADGDDRRRGGTMTVATLPVDVRAGGRV
jgi:hypothetical protein